MSLEIVTEEQVLAGIRAGKTNAEMSLEFGIGKTALQRKRNKLKQKGLLEPYTRAPKVSAKRLTKGFCEQYGGGTPDQIIRSGRATIEQWCTWIQQPSETRGVK